MPWVFVGSGQPLTGIGYGPMTEAEYRERVAAYEAQFVDGEGSVRKSGLYKRVSEDAAAEKDQEVAEALSAPVVEPTKEPE